MSDDGVAALLDDRPELTEAVEAVSAVDAEHDTWTFDDVPVDSGEFGELVSRGIVEREGDEYRLADPQRVRAALDGDSASEASLEAPDIGSQIDIGEFVDPREAGFLAAALAVVVVARAYVVGSIYRGDDIVLSGNDPYYYRYWVEQIAAESTGRVDFGSLSVLPDAVTKGEPLMIATLWWVAELLGGTKTVIGHVLAWYPVVSAVVSGLFVYLLAVQLTDDRRVGLAGVLMLAFLPGHAFRTSLGYADHHAFDYIWLGLTALTVVVLLAGDRENRLQAPVTWLAAAGLGIGIAGQVLAWEAGPLLILPVGFAVAAATIADAWVGTVGRPGYLPVVVGVGLSAVLTWGVHAVAGWHTGLVASVPALLFAGVVGVVVVAQVVDRLSGRAIHLFAVEAIGAILTPLLVSALAPEWWADATQRTEALFRSDAIVETGSLFDPQSLPFFLLFGFTLALALPVMAWAVSQGADGRVDWLTVGVYAWYFLALAGLQVRFVGELATFVAVFAGFAFVWVAARIDLVRPVLNSESWGLDVPKTRTLGALVVLFLLFGGFGILQVPVKTSQVVIDDGTYETAAAIEANAAERELSHPQNYVLSQWGRNRVYNYFVNGESQNYGYARRTYGEFIVGTDPAMWYVQLQNRVGYVVTTPASSINDPQTMYSRLDESYGSRNGSVSGVAHYQHVYTSADGDHKAFALVPGATLQGVAESNTTVTVTTDLSVPDRTVEYTRQVTVGADGQFAVTVANPGQYTIETSSGIRTATVPTRAVTDGANVSVGNKTG